MAETVERRDTTAKWFVESKSVEIVFLDETFRFHWEVVIDLGSGLMVGDVMTLEENGETIADAVKVGLYGNPAPSVILLDKRSEHLLQEAHEGLAGRGVRIPIRIASDSQSIRKFEIVSALEPLERRVLSPKIGGRTRRQVAMEILRALLGNYQYAANRMPKRIEKRRARTKQATAKDEAAVIPSLSVPNGGRKRILIAEDSPTGLQLLEKAFSDAGYETFLARDGEEAERLIHTERLDAVVLDIVMPKRNGYQVCRQIRKQPNYQYLPIVFISSKSEAMDRIWGLRQGASEYFVKPFRVEDLVSTVNRFVYSSAPSAVS